MNSSLGFTSAWPLAEPHLSPSVFPPDQHLWPPWGLPSHNTNVPKLILRKNQVQEKAELGRGWSQPECGDPTVRETEPRGTGHRRESGRSSQKLQAAGG